MAGSGEGGLAMQMQMQVASGREVKVVPEEAGGSFADGLLRSKPRACVGWM